MLTAAPQSTPPGLSKAPAARLRVSTPGRVCLFGEHQDYLHLPVIPCAISVRIGIDCTLRSDREVHLNLPDIASHDRFSLTGPLAYGAERDYLRSAVNVLLRRGFSFSHGCDCTVRGNIPINSGTSSSSALVVTWINLLAQISDQHTVLEPLELARYAHEAEVLEFGEPGGMMDHYSTALGGVLTLEFHPEPAVEQMKVELGTFVLGDSGEPKDTRGILARVKNGVLRAVRHLEQRHPGFSLAAVTAGMLETMTSDLTIEERELLAGTLRNRDLTVEAHALLSRRPLDHHRLGTLLTEHQEVLRDVLRISTPKIDRMIAAGIAAGAYGGKINGSGGGGCMFVYAPEHAERVAAAIEREGGRAYIVTVDAGSRNDSSSAID